MHFVQSKSILSSTNGMNIYRGCSHGCIYCDSRSKCYNMNHDFEDIEVKENSLKLLKQALLNKKQKSMVGMGSMSDPYVPIESKLQYTREAIKLVSRYNFGFTLITKSDLVLRDLDLFEELNNKSKAVLQMTLTTYDDNLCKILEPNVAPTSKRVKVLKEFDKKNIPTVVWLSPILPFINDTEENIEGIIDYCIKCNVKGIICFGMGLTLREGNREYFYSKLDENFPNLKNKYIKMFGDSYGLPSPNRVKLMKLFKYKTEEYGIMNNPEVIFEYLHKYPNNNNSTQTTLF